MPSLRVVQGPKTGASIPLGDRPLKVGRDRSCPIHIGHESISREHAELRPVGDQWMVADLGSSNGTFVNGSRIERRPLSEGDEIKIGDIVLRFIARGEEPAALATDDAETAPPPPPTLDRDAPPAAPATMAGVALW